MNNRSDLQGPRKLENSGKKSVMDLVKGKKTKKFE